jgi:uncharacterized membrane protein
VNPADTLLVSTRLTPDTMTQANVHGLERAASLIGGGLLLAHGLRSGGPAGWFQALLGGLALARGASGRCPAKRALLQPTPFESRLMEDHHWHSAKALSRSVTIDRPREELYRYWRDFGNLANFMSFIESVEVLTDERAHWVAHLPLLGRVEWTSRLTEDKPGERLAWMSEADTPLRNLGWVSFTDAPLGRGTEVQAVIAYEPPAGRLGYAFAQTFGRLPLMKAAQDLRRFKQLMETGEIATSRLTTQADARSLPRPTLTDPLSSGGIH